MNHNIILDVQGLSVNYQTYYGTVSALRDVTFKLKEKQSLGIIGESGSGKSTLAFSIMNYLASNGSTDGNILYQGENILEKSEREMVGLRGNKIAMVYQNPYSSLNPSLTIGKQLDEVTIFHRNLSKKDARKESVAILKDLYLGDAEGLVKRFPHQISGGMQQRICIAMALLCRPDLMILDEPTTALDVTTEAVILDLINDLKKRYQMSMIYISHDMGVVNKVSDNIAVMYRGEVVEYGDKKSMFHKPEHPYTRALINCIPRSGIVKEEYRLNTIPGYVRKRSIDEGGCPFLDRCGKRVENCESRYGLREIAEDHFTACDRAFAKDVADDSLIPKKVDVIEKTEDGEALNIVNLYKTFNSRGKKVRAVDGLNFSLKKNNVLGIVGESGCGKSTLGYTVTGLLKPSKGKIYFDGTDISMTWKRRSPEVLKEIQLIFQNPGRSLNPSFTIEQIIGRPMKRLLGIKSKTERRERIIEILKQVDLGKEYLKRKATQLSGGEMQRVAVARAFVLSPGLIVCDEPTSALDVSVQSSVLNLLTDLQQRSGASYIFISHDLNVVNYISDYIMVMYLGRIVEFGKRDEVTSPPYHPYTEALLSAVPDVDPALTKGAVRLEGAPPNPTKKIKGCPFAGRCHKKIGEICENVTPEPVGFGEIHSIACHLYSAD
ncbi:MAG: ABC transporter ATP-binding protein [Spirochaetales bacterium]|uniref:ABC transporter ATP-binding protein n=1 Tax=Candidatus Thalassospirochaeta sargassi TaxID=3119039 RepID=A0AAJ1MJV1_9SPIO|nr:ABC transporter ATP-binding protein [Spirochaetales bacterium]